MTDEETRDAQEREPEGTASSGAPTPPTPPTPPRPSDIANLMERVFLMGIGAASITREKIEEFSDELVERGRISQGDAKKVADWMSEQAAKQANAVERTMRSESAVVVSQTGAATKKDIDGLQEQIVELKAMIASMRGGAEPTN